MGPCCRYLNKVIKTEAIMFFHKQRFFSCFIFVLFALTALGVSADTADVQSMLQRQENLNNKAITDYYKQISQMYGLSQREVRNPKLGMKLEVVKKNGAVHFRLKGHKFEENFDREMIGFSRDSVSITFKDKKIARIERIFYKKSFANEQTLVLRIVDPNPMQESHNDIMISRTENGVTKLRTKFGDMKNTAGNPYRNNLKSAYSIYLKDLIFVLNRIDFETEKYEKKRNKEAIENFPSILNY